MGVILIRRSVLTMVLLGAAACGQGGDHSGQTIVASNQTDGAICVPAPETGQYFVFEGGKFVPTSAPSAEIIERVVVQQAELDWAEKVEDQFPGLGYSWMGLNVRRNTATLIGVAPDAVTKEAAFTAGEVAIRSDPNGADLLWIPRTVLRK